MSGVSSMTLGEVGRRLGRYGPYLALVTALAVVVGLAPAGPGGSASEALDAAAGAPVEAGAPVQAGADAEQAAAVGAAAPAAGLAGADPADGAPGAAGGPDGPAAGAAAPDAAPVAGGPAPADRASSAAGPGAAAPRAVAGARNCDPATGRVRMPTFNAVDCVPGFDGDNGGATARGVTTTTIKVAVYRVKPEPTADAIAAAGGSDDTSAQVEQQYREWLELYQSQHETYGRKVELVFLNGSGAATDDAAGRADALKVVQMGAFASLNAPNTAYIDELAARGILCIQCGIDAPFEYYVEKAPHVYAYGMSASWTIIHIIEMMEKYLVGGKAQYAGDPLMKDKPRKFGLIAYDTAKGDYKKSHAYFLKQLKKRGIPLAVDAVYNGYPDTAKSQQQARPIIQKMKQAGVTTIIFYGDPFAPIFFTQEATRQQYFPEWNGNGPLVDTAFFARLYDQQQWRNAFGQSSSTVRLPDAMAEGDRLLQWYYGRGPTAKGGYNLIRLPVSMLMSGIHYAGEQLTATSFAAGQFARPLRRGGKTYAALSYGTRLWPAADYTGVDDKTFIFWDADEPGEDEIGGAGVGLYRYVNGGQRYLPGQYPSSLRLFSDAGTVTVLRDYPADERPPDYPRPRR